MYDKVTDDNCGELWDATKHKIKCLMHQLQKKRGDDNKKEKEKLEAIVKQSDQVGGQDAKRRI